MNTPTPMIAGADARAPRRPRSPPYPWRPVIGQFFCTIAFRGPFCGISGVLLPAKLGIIDPAHKVAATASAVTVTRHTECNGYVNSTIRVLTTRVSHLSG